MKAQRTIQLSKLEMALVKAQAKIAKRKTCKLGRMAALANRIARLKELVAKEKSERA